MRKLVPLLMFLFLVLVPSAVALPSDQTFAVATKGSAAKPPAGAAYPVAPHNGQARAPKTGKTPRRRRSSRRPRVSTPPHLQAIAACESGGNPRALDSTGTYRGKYQFTISTWRGVGGSGDPAAASEPEQDRRAAVLYARGGAGQWPGCAQ